MSEKIEIDPREAMAQRVEEARKRMFADRDKHRANAAKITAELLNGIDIKEDIVVKLINGQYGLLELRPLAEGEIVKIFSSVGIGKITKLSASGEFSMDDYDFFWSLVSASSGIDKELLKKTLVMGESSIAAQKILELSGFSPDSNKEIDSFPTQ